MPNSSKIRFTVRFDVFRETNLQIVTIQYLLMVYVTSLKIRFSRAHFEGVSTTSRNELSQSQGALRSYGERYSFTVSATTHCRPKPCQSLSRQVVSGRLCLARTARCSSSRSFLAISS